MPEPSMMDYISEYISTSRSIVGLFKDLRSLLSAGQPAKQMGKEIETAERALKMTEAQLAKALNYHLCQCTFPPQIMLSIGRHSTHDIEMFRCPGCGKQEPSEAHFRGNESDNRLLREMDNSWMA
jgi:hypothetical protein